MLCWGRMSKQSLTEPGLLTAELQQPLAEYMVPLLGPDLGRLACVSRGAAALVARASADAWAALLPPRHPVRNSVEARA